MVGWRRDDVFITNVVKCRPPGNRDPEADEMAACAPFLRRQLEVLDPALVVTLGRFSLQTFMPGDTISRVHGTTRPIDPASGARAATGYAMYHPAAALRQAALRETMQRDMAAVPETLMRAREGRATLPEAVGPPPSPAPGAALTGASSSSAPPAGAIEHRSQRQPGHRPRDLVHHAHQHSGVSDRHEHDHPRRPAGTLLDGRHARAQRRRGRSCGSSRWAASARSART